MTTNANIVAFGAGVLVLAAVHVVLSEVAARRKLQLRSSGHSQDGQLGENWRAWLTIRVLAGTLAVGMAIAFWGSITESNMPGWLRSALIAIVIAGVGGAIAFGIHRTKVVLDPRRDLSKKPPLTDGGQ